MSPFRVARVRMAPTSEPASGSDMAMAQSASPLTRGGRNSRWIRSEPKRIRKSMGPEQVLARKKAAG